MSQFKVESVEFHDGFTFRPGKLELTYVTRKQWGVVVTGKKGESDEFALKDCQISTNPKLPNEILVYIPQQLRKATIRAHSSDQAKAILEQLRAPPRASQEVDEIEDSDEENKDVYKRNHPAPQRTSLAASSAKKTAVGKSPLTLSGRGLPGVISTNTKNNSSPTKQPSRPMYDKQGETEEDEYWQGAPATTPSSPTKPGATASKKFDWQHKLANPPRSQYDSKPPMGVVMGTYASTHQKYSTMYVPPSTSSKVSPFPAKAQVRPSPMAPARDRGQLPITALFASSSPMKYSTYQSSSLSPKLEWTGIQNVGNSCYIGATIRAMTALWSFTSDLGSDNIDFEDTAPSTFHRALLSMTDLVLNPERKGKVDPTPVKKAIGKYFQMFAGGQQQDAHEFFLSCITKIEEELYPKLRKLRAEQWEKTLDEVKRLGMRVQLKRSKKSKRRKKGAAGDSGLLLDSDFASFAARLLPLRKLPTLRCPTKRNFSGVLNMTLTCLTCNQTHGRREPFRNLEVDILSVEHLKQTFFGDTDVEMKTAPLSLLLQSFFADEEVEVRCESPGCSGTHGKLRRRILRLPRILVIHLKRFKPNYQKARYEKITSPVEIHSSFGDFCEVGSFGPLEYLKEDWSDNEQRRAARLKKLTTSQGGPVASSRAGSSSSALPSGKLPAATKPAATSGDSDDEVVILIPEPRKATGTGTQGPPAATGEAKRRKTQDSTTGGKDADTVDSLPSINKHDMREAHRGRASAPVAAPAKDDMDVIEAKYSNPNNSEYDLDIFDFKQDELPADKKYEAAAPPSPVKPTEDAIVDEDDEFKKVLEMSRKEDEERRHKQQLEEEELIQAALEASKREHERMQRALEETLHHEAGSPSSLHLVYPGASQDDALGSSSTFAVDASPAKEAWDPEYVEDMGLGEGTTEYQAWLASSPPPIESYFPPRYDSFLDDELLDDFDAPPLDESLFDQKQPPEPTPPTSYEYHLQCIIHHIGLTAGSGHYVTDAFDRKERKWIRQDDSKVYKIDDPVDKMLSKDNREETSYLLFYAHACCAQHEAAAKSRQDRPPSKK